MTVRPIAAALLAASALLVAACGEDPAAPAGEPSAQERRQAEVKFAQCMRDHGVDLPDPEGPGKGRTKVDSGVDKDEFEAAATACEKYRRQLRGPELSAEEKQRFKQAALEHARCMREHGIDMPDPTFPEEGGARIEMRGDVDPEDPEFQAAEKACGSPNDAMKRQDRQ